MRVAVMGSGGVGGYYGGLLARVGHEVGFVARGDHLAALQSDGLRVKSVHGDFDVVPVVATDQPSELGQVDLVLMTVKTPDVEQASRAIKPIVGKGTTVLSLLNGIEAPEQIGSVVGMEYVVAGATWISSAVEAPGVIHQFSQFRRIVFGEQDGSLSDRVQSIAAVLASSGVDVEVTDSIDKVLWTKFVFIAGISGMGALTRLSLGEYRDVPETRELLISLMGEVEAVGRAVGVELDGDVIEQSIAIVDSAVPQVRASMQRDVEEGRRSELESMIGVIRRKGRELEVPTPVADAVYAALLPAELIARAQ
jgi:2-dehydropantoate 2-reductase